MAKRSRRRPPRSTIFLRWAAVAGIGLVVFLYYRPLRSYQSARHALAERRAEVRVLQAEKGRLERRLEEVTSGLALVRGARRLGLVKPGEHLFIVKGIPQWRRARRATIRSRG